MSESSGFLDYYQQTIKTWVTDADIPQDIKEHYAFESLIKQQAGREVYFVTRLSDGKRAVLRVTAEGDAESVAVERDMLQKLHHSALPTVLGTWIHKGRGYMARECFPGDDLFTHVRKHGPMSFDMLTDIAIKLCDILTYIHGQSPPIIHRDIKPENLILTAEREVKLIDFDIARTFREDATTDTQVIGTKPYMAPEQFGSEQSDNRADIYALGMVMIFLATGKPDKTALKSGYPYKALVPIIETCIRKDRDQRFKNAAQLKRRLLWARRGMTRKLLLSAGLLSLLLVSFLAGFALGHGRGLRAGVVSILEQPHDKNRPYSQAELMTPVTFDNHYIDLAVRNYLNKKQEDVLYLTEVNRVDALTLFGTHIPHPSIPERLIKTHVDKGAVNYMTGSGFWINVRGDLSSFKDVPKMYYLRRLWVTSQHITDLSPLSGMKLTDLMLCNNFVGNLLPLKDMPSLLHLDVCQNPLKDLRPIGKLYALKTLDISQTGVTDLRPLTELSHLEVLRLSYTDVQDIGVLKGLPNLREVDVSHTKVSDLRPLLRKEKPITVYCAGLQDEVMAALRGNPGIILVETAPPEY